RRRHTSSYRDWSSDVCSSDLGALALLVAVVTGIAGILGAGTWLTAGISLLITAASYAALRGLVILDSKRRARERERLSISEGFRSEERRGGGGRQKRAPARRG